MHILADNDNGNVLKFPSLEEDSYKMPSPDDVLKYAKGKLKEVIVLGIEEDGELYFASSTKNIPKMSYLTDKFKDIIMKYSYYFDDYESEFDD